jgi:hypothetical protein
MLRLAQENIRIVDQAWESISSRFQTLSDVTSRLRMDREEISFHDQVKLLGHLCLILKSVKGDILEIGVWKGKSLALMSLFSDGSKVIGVDPLEFKNQQEEVNYFRQEMFPSAVIIADYAEYAVNEVLRHSRNFKLVHIDGGHKSRNVCLDFLLYSPLVLSGGFLVFDDYGDHEFSPEVKPSVDMLIKNGLVEDFVIIGQIKEFPNSFILRKN